MKTRILVASLLFLGTQGLLSNTDATSSDGALSLVPDENRSAPFEKVATRLDLGGYHFSYTDVQGAHEAVGAMLSELITNLQEQDPNFQIPFPIDVPGLIKELGFDALEAIGSSGIKEGGYARNKSFVYLPSGRKGLFAISGGEAHEFTNLRYTTADTDLFYTMDFNGKAIFDIVKNIAQAYMGEMGLGMINAGIQQQVPNTEFTWADIINGLDTEVSLIMRLGETQALALPNLPKPLDLPKFECVLILKKYGWILNHFKAQAPAMGMEVIEDPNVMFMRLPLPPSGTPMDSYHVGLALDKKTGDLIITTEETFFEKCWNAKSGLTETQAFQDAIAGLPAKGNGLFFTSPKAFRHLTSFLEQTEENYPESKLLIGIYSMYLPILSVEANGLGAAYICVNENDGILYDSRSPAPKHNIKTNGGPAMAVGLLAAMAIPAFNKVRTTSQDKTITNNLRQIASAADQYFIESGETEANYEDLFGPEKYIISVQPIAGEDYSTLFPIKLGFTELSITKADGTVVTYGM